MRYSKTIKVNDVETETYNYVYSDTKLIAVTFTKNSETNTARFIYDSNDVLRGFILNDNQTYLYVKNLQGDIISIVDETGTILLNYSYDSWGDVDYIIPSGSNLLLAAMLATLNPFTYRSYCYDYDIGLYYLQSRYYDPELCRFINADSTDYLGVSGTLVSYNLFAYCDNEPVGTIDATGTWGYDVHCGYYTDENIDIYLYDFENEEDKKFSEIKTKVKKAKSKNISVLSFTKNYLFSNIKKVHIPYYNNQDIMASELYGTYIWAINSGFSCDRAKIIADCCNGIDKLFPPVSTSEYNQSWHFNGNWNSDETISTSSLNDTRLFNGMIMIFVASYYFETAKTTTNTTTKAELIKRGLQFLGYSLHPLQDSLAHTRDRCHKVLAYQPLYDVYGNFIGYHTIETPYWSHVVKDDITDVVAVR